MDDLLRDSLQRLLAQHASPAQVRAVEAGQGVGALWQAIEDQGVADCLVPSEHDGAGLTLRDLASVIALAGEVACPVPLAATMVARAVLAGQVACPRQPITMAAFGIEVTGQQLRAAQVPFALTSLWALVEVNERSALLLPVSAARTTAARVPGSLACDLAWDDISGAVRIPLAQSLRPTSAALLAGMMAGAMGKVQSITTAYANDRIQFGKPIAKFQAIQQQLAELAEEVAAGRMAAEIGLSAKGVMADPAHAALAKMRTSLAVGSVCAIAHAVHGAMGITQAYDLQLFTRRLHEWRMSCGSEVYWSGALGRQFLAGDDSFLDHIRGQLMPSE